MSNANSSSELLSAVDAVAIVSNLMPPRPVGALYIQNEDGTRSGKFYFKDGLIYAVKVDGYEFPLAYRAAHSGLIDEDDQRSALASAGGDPSNPLLVSIYLQRHLLDKKTVESYLKENFLAASGFLLSLKTVRAEWRDDEVTEDFAVRYIDVPTLISLCDKRASTLIMAAERMGTDVDGLFSSPIKMLREVNEEEKLSVEAIWTLHKAGSETTLDDAAAELGFTRLFLAKLIYRMWSTGIIEILAPTSKAFSDSESTPLSEEPIDNDSVPLYVSEDETDASESHEEFDTYSDLPNEEEAESLTISLTTDETSEDPNLESISFAADEEREIADPFQVETDFSAQEETIPFESEPVDLPTQEEVIDSDELPVESGQFIKTEQLIPSVIAEPQHSSSNEQILDYESEPMQENEESDEEFALLTQAIVNLTERARLANVHVETVARVVEDASAAVRQSEEEAASIAQVLNTLHNEVHAQEERLALAENKVAEQRRQEEQSRVEAQQAQTQAFLLSQRLEKLRSSF